ncbi:MAG: hypothetical protein AAGH90_00260 [Pseudomonadota bacterium]
MASRIKLAGLAAAIMLAVSCESYVQTTSGADYLARYDETHLSADRATHSDIDADIRDIAAIEPTLDFPARIGLARIEHGRLSAIPADEGYIWQDTLADLGPLYGEFVPVSPLIAASVAKYPERGMASTPATTTIANIRRGAARQHLDFVLVYEVGSSSAEKANALAFADLTVIGMFVLPSRSIDVEASASGLMIDVRTGYPYATLTAHSEKSGVSRAVSEYSSRRALADTAEERAVEKLAEEFNSVMEELARASLK